MQVKRWGLVLVHNVLGLQELLTFTEQSDVPGALLRATGAELGRGPQRLPPWEAWVRSQLWVSAVNHTLRGLSKHKLSLKAQRG